MTWNKVTALKTQVVIHNNSPHFISSHCGSFVSLVSPRTHKTHNPKPTPQHIAWFDSILISKLRGETYPKGKKNFFSNSYAYSNNGQPFPFPSFLTVRSYFWSSGEMCSACIPEILEFQMEGQSRAWCLPLILSLSSRNSLIKC